MSMYELDHAELSTVLAALRFYEDKGLGEPYNRPEWIHEIATDGGAVMASLDSDAIDALCERLNSESDDLELVAQTRAVALLEPASDAAKLLESVAPHHPQTAKLRAALALAEGGVK